MSGATMNRTGQVFLIVSEAMRRFVKPREGEVILVVADSETSALPVEAIVAAAQSYKADPVVMTLAPSFLEQERELPDIVWKALEETDIYMPLLATTDGAHHREVGDALYNEGRKRRIRLFGLPELRLPGTVVPGGVSAVDFDIGRLRIPDSDWQQVREMGLRYAAAINGGKELRLTSEAGTDLVASIEGHIWHAGSPICCEPGTLSGLGMGEAYGGPVEGTAEGTIVIDGPMTRVADGKPVLDEPIVLTIKQGRVTDVRGGKEAESFKRLMERSRNADVVAEIAFGTGHVYRPMGFARLHDKFVVGTIHVGFGLNGLMCWPDLPRVSSDIHNDAVLLKPSAWVDDKQILREGVPLV